MKWQIIGCMNVVWKKEIFGFLAREIAQQGLESWQADRTARDGPGGVGEMEGQFLIFPATDVCVLAESPGYQEFKQVSSACLMRRFSKAVYAVIYKSRNKISVSSRYAFLLDSLESGSLGVYLYKI